MPKVRLDSKFTYWNGAYDLWFPSYTSRPLNFNIYNKSEFSGIAPVLVTPQTVLPMLGNSHNERHGNRITVTSIRWKSIIHLMPDFLKGNYNPFTTTDVKTTDPPHRFFKIRYMLVQWDNDYAGQIDEAFIYKWFKMTYCWWETPSTSTVDVEDMPVSVHSNILHETTELTSKFNILCDKCMVLSSDKPQVSLDITIPLNKNYLFDEDDPSTLIYPCYSLFILPPLSMVTDLDPITGDQYYAYQATNSVSKVFAKVDNFTKLNFIDL